MTLIKTPSGVCPFHGDCFEGLASGAAMEKRWGQRGDTLPNDHPAWELEVGYIAQAHTLIQAFNAIARIAAPSLLFKLEAIVHPDDVVKYISPKESQLSYNPLLMALLWNSLATRQINLLSQTLVRRFKIHPETAWVNYVRSHDDIGWAFSDEDAALLGVNGRDHRRFLNEFYRGRFNSALPSMTGKPALGPMSPRPSTRVPSLTTATVFHLLVYS